MMRGEARLEGPLLQEEAIKSTGIRAIRYDERARTLDVTYANSGEYRYFDVPPEVYAWLSKVESKGRFVNRLVKEQYRYEKLGGEAVASEESDLEQLLRDSLKSPSPERSES
jgi:KTSC domain-containing protein